MGNSALQHRFHGCVTAVTCARACGAGDERQRSGDVPEPSRSAGHGAAQPRVRGAVRDTEQLSPVAGVQFPRGAAGGAKPPRDPEPAAPHPPEKLPVGYGMWLNFDVQAGPKYSDTVACSGFGLLLIFAVISGKQ